MYPHPQSSRSSSSIRETITYEERSRNLLTQCLSQKKIVSTSTQKYCQISKKQKNYAEKFKNFGSVEREGLDGTIEMAGMVGFTMSLNLLLLVAMVATNTLSFYHLSSNPYLNPNCPLSSRIRETRMMNGFYFFFWNLG